MSMHSFDPKVAEQVGVNAAVIYQNIIFWCEKNHANRRHAHDGYTWTYNSRRAFAELFPYLTEKQVRGGIERLVSADMIVIGSYNKSGMDKTNWYAPKCSADWPAAISPTGLTDRTYRANGSDQEGKPIPDSKPDDKPDEGKGRADRADHHNASQGNDGSGQAREVETALSRFASPDAARSFIAYRRKIRKALTITAARRIATQLEKVLHGQGDPDDALGMAEEKGWQSVQADWYFNAKTQRKPNGTTDRAQFDAAIRETAKRLTEGTIRIDYSSRDPFAAR